jgi:fucose permease
MFMIGIGIGTYEGVTDAMLMDIHPERESLHININHFFVTFGSILITGYLIFLQMNWRNAIVQAGLVVIGLAVLFALIKLSTKKKNTEPYLARMAILTRDKLVLVFFAATALVVGIEAGTIGILTTFLMDERAFTQVTSKIGLVIFLLGMAIGRVIIGVFAPQEKINRVLLLLFGSSVAIYSILYFIDLQWITFGIIFVAGLSLSALLPLMLTKVGLIYKDMSGTVLGTLKVAIPIGGILIPFLMSNLVRYTNFNFSLVIFPTSCLIAFLLIYRVTSVNSRVD